MLARVWFSVVLAQLVLVSGCAEPGGGAGLASHGDSEARRRAPLATRADLFIYPVADNDCHAYDALAQLPQETPVWMEDAHGDVRQLPQDLSRYNGSFRGRGFRGAIVGLISDSTRGEHTRGHPLHVCRPDADYERETAESVALSTLARIEMGLSLFDSWKERNQRQGRVSYSEILVHPVLHAEGSYHVNGMRIYGWQRGNALEVWPHTRAWAEVLHVHSHEGMSVAHEVGHLVHSAVVPDLTQIGAHPRGSHRGRLARAFLEAFADVWGHESASQDPRLAQALRLSTLPHDPTRDMRATRLIYGGGRGADGYEGHKVIDAEAVSFAHGHIPTSVRHNMDPRDAKRLVEPYHLAAILAHAWYKLVTVVATRDLARRIDLLMTCLEVAEHVFLGERQDVDVLLRELVLAMARVTRPGPEEEADSTEWRDTLQLLFPAYDGLVAEVCDPA